MRKFLSYLVLAPVVLLSLVPAIKLAIPMPTKDVWFWYILIAGFLGFYTLFIKTNVFVKIIAIGSFINCFFSSAPYISFTAYISIISCCYFYILCSKVEHWKPIFKGLLVVLLLNVFLIFMQAIGKDALLSFGLHRTILTGTMGQNMQMGSLSVILTAFLVSFSPLIFALPFLIGICANSIWSLFCAGIGAFSYLLTKSKKVALIVFLVAISIFSVLTVKQGKLGNLSDNGRLGVWKKTIALANQKPLTGWGAGTYQYLFPTLGGMKTMPWKTAHNDFLQVLFELGYPGLLVMIALFGWLFFSLLRIKEYLCLAGLVMVAADMQVHFPMRILQIVPIIILFMAYCNYRIKEKLWLPNLTS